MSLAPRLDLRQSQSLVMTPQLQQAIKLLALSNLEIEGFIAEEIERNPLLEAGAADDGDRPDRDAGPEPDDAAPRDAPRDERVAADELVSGSVGSDEPALDIDYATESHHQDSVADGGSGTDGALSMSGAGAGGGSDGDGNGLDLDGFADTGLSLADHLLTQAGPAIAADDAFVAAHLIDQIDEAGYLTVPLLEIANRLGVALARVEHVLAVIQTFDPTGVGARDRPNA